MLLIWLLKFSPNKVYYINQTNVKIKNAKFIPLFIQPYIQRFELIFVSQQFKLMHNQEFRSGKNISGEVFLNQDWEIQFSSDSDAFTSKFEKVCFDKNIQTDQVNQIEESIQTDHQDKQKKDKVQNQVKNQQIRIFSLYRQPKKKEIIEISDDEEEDRILEIGNTFLKNCQIRIEFFSWQKTFLKNREFPMLKNEIELHDYDYKSIFKIINNRKQKIPDFQLISGWIFSANLKDLLGLFLFAEQLRKNQKCGVSKQQFGTILVILPYEVLQKNELFHDFTIPIPFIQYHQRNDYFLAKNWGNIRANLCFLYFFKKFTNQTQNGFNYLEGKEIKILKKDQISKVEKKVRKILLKRRLSNSIEKQQGDKHQKNQ